MSPQIAIRIAGIDAPESAHFGKAAQPLSAEALEWLRNYVLHRRVRAYVYRHDQYDRIVASVYVRRGLFRKDVGLQMLKAGLATVYEAKTGAEFGELEAKYREAESKAKYGRRGVWSLSKKQFESPRDYKTRTAEQSEAKAQATTSTSSWLPWR
jgi:endonuclease YncB( thermonuclease family)